MRIKPPSPLTHCSSAQCETGTFDVKASIVKSGDVTALNIYNSALENQVVTMLQILFYLMICVKCLTTKQLHLWSRSVSVAKDVYVGTGVADTVRDCNWLSVSAEDRYFL